MRFILMAALALSTMAADAAAAGAPVELAPASPWVVDYADNSCRLHRRFGTGDDAIILTMDQFEPGDTFAMMLHGKRMTRNAEHPKASLRFGPTEGERQVTFRRGLTNGQPTAIVTSSLRLAPMTEEERAKIAESWGSSQPYKLSAIGAAREAAVTWLEVQGAARFDVRLNVGPMNKPLEALRTCSWDMVEAWGLDVAVQKTLSRPVASLGRAPLLTYRDYPVSAVDKGARAVVNFALLIDEQGRASNCTIQRSTRPKEFDNVVCKSIMKRGRFAPALDANGRPVKSYWAQTIVFDIA